MKKIGILLITVLLITSCEDKSQKKYESLNFAVDNSFGYTNGNSISSGAVAVYANYDVSSDGIDDLGSEIIESDKVKQGVERKLIKNGRITFETQDLQKTKNQITSAVKKYKGYISSDSQNEQYDRINNHLKVRVPFEKFDSLLVGISKEIEKFDQKEIKISDVTEEFLDVQTRLKNKKELEKKYLDILKKAKTVKEILEVEKEIGSLREDIESAEGKLKYLSDQVSFSTLNISFYKKISNESSFSRKLKNALKDGYESIKSFFVYIVSNWPVAIIILILLIWFKRRNKKK
jgi:hypothetical protein